MVSQSELRIRATIYLAEAVKCVQEGGYFDAEGKMVKVLEVVRELEMRVLNGEVEDKSKFD